MMIPLPQLGEGRGGGCSLRRTIFEKHMSDTALIATLRKITTATITTVLLKKGIRRTWMKGPKMLRDGQARIAGRAFTLRFVPTREDLATPASWSSPRSTRAAIEDMPEGCIAVIDAMGVTDAGVFGDILAQRMKVRQVAGLVTDGAMRDVAGVLETGLPIWCQGATAPASVAGLPSRLAGADRLRRLRNLPQ